MSKHYSQRGNAQLLDLVPQQGIWDILGMARSTFYAKVRPDPRWPKPWGRAPIRYLRRTIVDYVLGMDPVRAMELGLSTTIAGAGFQSAAFTDSKVLVDQPNLVEGTSTLLKLEEPSDARVTSSGGRLNANSAGLKSSQAQERQVSPPAAVRGEVGMLDRSPSSYVALIPPVTFGSAGGVFKHTPHQVSERVKLWRASAIRSGSKRLAPCERSNCDNSYDDRDAAVGGTQTGAPCASTKSVPQSEPYVDPLGFIWVYGDEDSLG